MIDFFIWMLVFIGLFLCGIVAGLAIVGIGLGDAFRNRR